MREREKRADGTSSRNKKKGYSGKSHRSQGTSWELPEQETVLRGEKGGVLDVMVSLYRGGKSCNLGVGGGKGGTGVQAVRKKRDGKRRGLREERGETASRKLGCTGGQEKRLQLEFLGRVQGKRRTFKEQEERGKDRCSTKRGEGGEGNEDTLRPSQGRKG